VFRSTYVHLTEEERNCPDRMRSQANKLEFLLLLLSMATNQKVGSSNLSGRTCGIQQAKTHPLKIAKDAAPPFVDARYLGCLNPVGAFNQSLEIENVTVRHPPKLEVESQITAAH
jgi:hypothetical protein